MDEQTLVAYDRAAKAFADEWHGQPAPVDLHELVRHYFRRGLTADIGCGSGRDVAWLNENFFPAVGYDPSEGLLAEARARYPEIEFHQAALPELIGIPHGIYVNVLCETVIMHLDPAEIRAAIRKLTAILKPGGTLYVSWRVTEGDHVRDAHGRLYTAFGSSAVMQALKHETVVFDEQRTSVSSGKTIHRIIARKART